MKKIYSNIIIITLALFVVSTACTDLNVQPQSSTTSNVVFQDPASYKAFLAKLYAGLAVSGQAYPDNDGTNRDIYGISDAGFSAYMRQYWSAQELSTDEAVIGWNDGTLPTFHLQTWTPQNEFLNAMFSRVYFQISQVNEFLRQTTESQLTERAVNDTLKVQVKQYRAEARLLRAMSYWHGLDLFGNIPLVSESNPVGTEGPGQPVNGKQDVYNFIESELKDIEGDLGDARKVEYGRADKAVAWMLLAKLYLNSETYVGIAKYTECLTYLTKILQAGYTIDPVYKNLFSADNNKSPEIIFSVNFDGLHTQSYGGTTFIVHAAIVGAMKPTDYGVASGWGGLRTTPTMVNLFPNVNASGTSADHRAIFYTSGQVIDIPQTPTTSPNQGYGVPKFTNKTSTGSDGSNNNFVDTDFPMFRLADVYLMYVEAVMKKGSGGDINTAVNYINELRQRAYGNTSGNITATDIDENFILDERGRELYWEGHRRTDLIRFKHFADNPSNNSRGLWAWKGDVKDGQATEAFRNVYPIPSSAIIANPKLVQNEGY